MATSATPTINEIERIDKSPINDLIDEFWRPTWPEPSDSIRTELQGYAPWRCWDFKKDSTADKYFDDALRSEIIFKLQTELSRGKRAPVYFWTCEYWMVGKVEDTACPTAVFCYPFGAELRKKARGIIQKCVKNPRARVKSLNRGCPVLCTGNEDDRRHTGSSDRDYQVLCSRNAKSIYGARIEIYYKEAEFRRAATLGGVIFANNKPYGLTVNHVFDGQPEGPPTAPDQVRFDEDSNADHTASTSQVISELRTAHDFHPISDTVDQPWIRGVIPLGKLAYAGSRERSIRNKELDWALIDIEDDAGFMDLNDVEEMKGLRPRTIGHPSAQGEVLAVMGSAIVDGTALSMPAYVALPGFLRPVRMMVVKLKQPAGQYFDGCRMDVRTDMVSGTEPGDCGSWVLDLETSNVCGQIVARLPGTTMAYAIPAQDIAQSIRDTTDSEIFLPSATILAAYKGDAEGLNRLLRSEDFDGVPNLLLALSVAVSQNNAAIIDSLLAALPRSQLVAANSFELGIALHSAIVNQNTQVYHFLLVRGGDYLTNHLYRGKALDLGSKSSEKLSPSTGPWPEGVRHLARKVHLIEYQPAGIIPNVYTLLELVPTDLVLFLALLQHVRSIVSPLGSFGSGALDELYPSSTNIMQIAIHYLLFIIQFFFMVSLPLFPVLSLWMIVLYVAGVLMLNAAICKVLNGETSILKSQTPLDHSKYDSERWIFINGSFTGRHWLQCNIDRIAMTFGRPVIGLHNPTKGLIFDLIQYLIDRHSSYIRSDIQIGYVDIKSMLLDPTCHKVIFILHGHGCIKGSLIVDALFRELPQGLLRKLEVYTFGNAATSFTFSAPGNIETRDSPPPHVKTAFRIEHYANTDDFISKIGILDKMRAPSRNTDLLFMREGSGHFFNQHYLDTMFPLHPETGRVMDTNEFMETFVEFAAANKQEGPIRTMESHEFHRGDQEDLEVSMEPSGSRANAVVSIRVKDCSRLWLYRNGMSPPS